MDRTRDEQTLEKTHDLLDQSRRLLDELDRQIEHGDAGVGGQASGECVQSDRTEDSAEEAYRPPRRPK